MPKTKGSHVISAVKVLRSQRQRALALLPPRLHHYLEERILASSWYPMEDQFELLRAIAAMMPASPDPYVIMGRGTARMDLAGIYRNQLRDGDPARSLTAMSVIWRTANDSGDVTTTLDGPRLATVRLSGYDFTRVERCRMVEGYLVEVVTLASGRDARATHSECSARGAVDCVWRVTWS
jgi:hypothetical protein